MIGLVVLVIIIVLVVAFVRWDREYREGVKNGNPDWLAWIASRGCQSSHYSDKL